LSELRATQFVEALIKLSRVIRDVDRLRVLIRLADESGDFVGAITRLGHLMDNLPYDEALKTRYVGELVDMLGHQADHAASLGLGATKMWSDDAFRGAARFMHLTGDAGRQAGDLGIGKRITEIALEGRKTGDFHTDVAEEFFTFVGKLPDPCPGCDELVGKGIGLRGSGLNLRAYGSTRLLADTQTSPGPDGFSRQRIVFLAASSWAST
jgi:hypothetical protein